MSHSKEHSARRSVKLKKEKQNRYKCKICGDYYRITSREYQSKAEAIRKSCSKPECIAKSFKNHFAKEKKRKEKQEKAAWKLRKQKWEHELEVAKRDDLQNEVNRIVRLIDQGMPCLANPTYNNTRLEAGHVFPRSGAPGIRYNLWNIHSQGNNSNRSQKDDAKMRDGLVKRYGEKRLEYLETERQKYPVIKEIDFDRTEATKIARQIIREWEKNPMTRDEVNEALGIYK